MSLNSHIKKLSTVLLLLLLFANSKTVAQYTGDDDPDDPANFKRHKGFHIGVFFGGYLPNKYTASNYDGYGFDLEGNKNSFENSWMYQKINTQYGGKNGSNQVDQIASALNVQHEEWLFDTPEYMPNHMKYQFGFLLGLNTQYVINKKNAILLNINFVKLNVTGSFTIWTKPPSNSSQINDAFKTFGIVGSEQRVLFQLGYQRLLSENQKTNFFIEGGINVTSTQFLKNEIEINSLKIDLVTNYNQVAYPTTTYYIRKPNKTGIGAFAGIGLDLVVGKRWLGQIVYDPTYEKVNIGINPKLKLQHTAGVRLYYRL